MLRGAQAVSAAGSPRVAAGQSLSALARGSSHLASLSAGCGGCDRRGDAVRFVDLTSDDDYDEDDRDDHDGTELAYDRESHEHGHPDEEEKQHARAGSGHHTPTTSWDSARVSCQSLVPAAASTSASTPDGDWSDSQLAVLAVGVYELLTRHSGGAPGRLPAAACAHASGGACAGAHPPRSPGSAEHHIRAQVSPQSRWLPPQKAQRCSSALCPRRSQLYRQALSRALALKRPLAEQRCTMDAEARQPCSCIRAAKRSGAERV